MISRLRQAGSSPLEASTSATVAEKRRLASCAGERFTEIPIGALSGRDSDQPAAWRQARSSTHRPIRSISPFSSATGMNSAGGIAPRCGCSHRSSASKPTIEESWSATTGWLPRHRPGAERRRHPGCGQPGHSWRLRTGTGRCSIPTTASADRWRRRLLALTHLVFWAEAATGVIPSALRGRLAPLVAPLVPALGGSPRLVAGGIRLVSQLNTQPRAGARL